MFIWGGCFTLLTALYVYFYSDDSTKEVAAQKVASSRMLDMHLRVQLWHIFAYIIWGNRGWLCMWIMSLLVVLYSKHRKQEKRVARYWKRKMEEYNKRSDEGAIMDSQDEFNHGVHPMDPNVMVYWKNKVGVVIWLVVSGMLMCNALEVLK